MKAQQRPTYVSAFAGLFYGRRCREKRSFMPLFRRSGRTLEGDVFRQLRGM